MPDDVAVAVIIPTRALSGRARLLHRAIESVLNQEASRPVPLVVVNGPDSDPELVRWLEREPRVRLIRREEPGIPGALAAGRAAVDTEWFSALDDDDMYLSEALAKRLQALHQNPHYDTVVTNGFVRGENQDRLLRETMTGIEKDPLGAMASGNWLLPGAWLCRTDAFGAAAFEAMPKYRECTYLAIRFSLHGRVYFIDEPTVVWHTDTPKSESKSREYVLGVATALECLLELPVPSWYSKRLQAGLAQAHYSAAALHLREGSLAEFWRSYWRALASPAGLRRMPLGWKMLAAALLRR